MIRVLFRNMDQSELAKEAVFDRLSSVVTKFPWLTESQVTVTLSTENSPRQAGPDLFCVRVRIHGGIAKGILLKASATSLYVALADVSDGLLERLNRFGDRNRVKSRTRERRLANGARQKC